MIRARYLDALDHDRFELLPGRYRRSFLREHAEFFGLDGDLYTSEYESRVAPTKPEPPPRTGVAFARRLGSLQLSRYLLRWIRREMPFGQTRVLSTRSQCDSRPMLVEWSRRSLSCGRDPVV